MERFHAGDSIPACMADRFREMDHRPRRYAHGLWWGSLLFFRGPQGQRLSALMVVGGLFSIIATNTLKFAVQRRRPFEVGCDRRLIREPFGNSFSERSQYTSSDDHDRCRSHLSIGRVALALLGLCHRIVPDLSRVHFPLDVALGMLLGIGLGHVSVRVLSLMTL